MGSQASCVSAIGWCEWIQGWSHLAPSTVAKWSWAAGFWEEPGLKDYHPLYTPSSMLHRRGFGGEGLGGEPSGLAKKWVLNSLESPITLPDPGEPKAKPKIYLTDHFIFLGVLALGLLAMAVRQWRLRKSESRRVKLEDLIATRTKALEVSNSELQKVQDRLVRAAHYAGKAEIATEVLHNVGNALNSVVVSVGILEEQTRGFKTDLYERLGPLFEKHQGELDWYLTEDPRGKKLLPAMKTMGKALRIHRERALKELETLQETVHEIKRIIRDQQQHADMGMHFEKVPLEELVLEALELQAGTLVTTAVKVKQEIQPGLLIRVPRIAFLQLLVNLIKNACEASLQIPPEARTISIQAWLKAPGWLHLEVQDQGMGVDEMDVTRIFRQGYSTKPGGNGFGLHYCGNLVSELGGQIAVRSEGLGQGACFFLDVPVADDGRSSDGI